MQIPFKMFQDATISLSYAQLCTLRRICYERMHELEKMQRHQHLEEHPITYADEEDEEERDDYDERDDVQ
jgi:hypothetical protein